MKRIAAGLIVFALTAAPALAQHAPSSHRLAPADEYFGKLKMSILGIRNTIKDVASAVEADPGRWGAVANKADFAEDALRDWQRKYPADTWLPKTLYALGAMYAKIDTDEGRKRRTLAMTWLVHDFPQSCYGEAGRAALEGRFEAVSCR